MEAGDGDTLARSQLALLYRLGLLQQDAGEVENDPHAFLNRLPPPAASAASPNEHTLSPSNDAVGLQTSGEHADWKATTTASAARSSPYASVRSPYEPLIHFKTHAVDSSALPRVPLSPLSITSRRSRYTHASLTASGQARVDTIDQRRAIQRQWFEVWKTSVEHTRQLAQADALGRRSIKRFVMHHWSAAVYRRRVVDARCRQLQCWKIQRVLHKWAMHAALHGRVTWFLTAQGRGFTLVNRLRRARGFVRWQRFVVWRRRRQRATARADAFYRHRFLRHWWRQWQVCAFHARRRRVVYRVFLTTLRHEQAQRRDRWQTACALYAHHTDDRLRRLLCRWRRFNARRQRDHVRMWHVRMRIQRGAYFAIWHTALCHKRRIEGLRCRVVQRVQREHVRTWYVAARAIVLSRSSTLWHPEAIGARYLCVWKRWTRETIRFRNATARVHAIQRRRALRIMRAWTTDHAQVARDHRVADAVTRRRRLLYVWENGWLVFHAKRQLDKKRAQQVVVQTQARALARWKRAWAVRHEWRTKKETARRMGLQSALQPVWDGWRRHTTQRRRHKRQLLDASRHHQQRLVMVGLTALLKRVDRKSSHIIAARRIRVRQRVALIRRVFHGWRNCIEHTASLRLRLDEFVARPVHLLSLWNPLRRAWLKWERFTQRCQRLQDLQHDHIATRKRYVFHAWQRRTRAVALQRGHVHRLEQRRRRTAFIQWRICTHEWRYKNELLSRAQLFHRQRHGTRVLCAWHAFVCLYARRIHRQAERVTRLHHHGVGRRTLRHWRAKLRQRQGFRALERQRRQAWLQFCWDVWHGYHIKLSKNRRKLRYFRQIYGVHPSTSPCRRIWHRWKAQTILGSSASNLRWRIQLGGVRACFSAWKLFRLAKHSLHQWHLLSVVASATNNDLGKRLRLFRRNCRLRVVRKSFHMWTWLVHDRQRQQAQLTVNRRRIVREIRNAEASRRRRRRCHLRMWFQRWRRRQLVSLHKAVRWYRRKLCFKVIREWWRHVVHRKQESLLQDARHTMENLSAHRRTAQPPPRRILERSRPTARPPSRTMTENAASQQPHPAASSTKKRLPPASARRMVDPHEHTNSYQQLRPRPGSQRQQHEPSSSFRDVSPAPSVLQEALRPASEYDPYKSLQVAQSVSQHPRCAQAADIQELPLYDDDAEERQQVSPSPQPGARSSPGATPSLLLSVDSVIDPLLSLESLVAMDPYSPVKQPSRRPEHPLASQTSQRPREPHRTASNAAIEHRVPVPTEPAVQEPTLYTASQSLRQRDTVDASPSRRPKTKQQRVIVKQELAELLEIPQRGEGRQASSTFRAVLHDMKTHSDDSIQDIDVDATMKAVVGYYGQMARHEAATELLEANAFCMLRDLGLFANGYYLGALEQAIQRLPSAERDLQTILHDLLSEFTERHPQYKAHSATTASAERNRTIDSLGWLVECFLSRRLGRAALFISKEKPVQPFWIRHELPREVIMSLPKLMKCIKKYQKPLEGFFAWRPDKTTSTANRGLMDHATFLLLLKHCKVYPQLFDRREVENAMECAGSCHHHGETTTSHEVRLDMPQFIEALLRCALRLRWIDEPSEQREASSSSSELVVVVKFLMLIFAMEGRGSMLTKRSQDLDVVMQFLQQQQDTHAKSAKLRRFQELLRAESTSTKVNRTKHVTAFRSAMSEGKTHARELDDVPLREAATYDHIHPSDDVQPSMRDAGKTDRDDLPDSVQMGARDLHHELQTRTKAKLPMPHRNDRDMDADGNSIKHHDRTIDMNHVGFVHERDHGVERSRLTVIEPPTAMEHTTPSGPESQGRVLRPHERSMLDTRVKQEGSADASDGALPDSIGAPSVLGSRSFHDLHATMDRDAFLNEILSSIQDVELLLHHSEPQRPSASSTPPDTSELRVELTSEPFSVAYPKRYAVLMNGQIPLGIEMSENGTANLPAEDVRISDPFLDSLTFADRFSESYDWQSHLSIADLAAHGIHAVFPSATHVRTALETSELDDLTDPQRTAAYLRAERDEDERLDQMPHF